MDGIGWGAGGASADRDVPPERLRDQVLDLLAQVRADGRGTLHRWGDRLERRRFRLSAGNFARYLALRRHDLRDLQSSLMPYGLSSLGRCEGRVEENLSAVAAALSAMTGRPLPGDVHPPGARRFFRGDRILRANTTELFGPVKRPAAAADGPGPRQVRILVTLPPEAATEPDLLSQLVAAGTDAVRINCAHDGPEAWGAMIRHLRAAEARHDRRVRILMDLAGPKVRTGAVRQRDADSRLRPGDRLLLTADDAPLDGGTAFQAVISLPGILPRVQPGHRVYLDDGKLATVAEAVAPGRITLIVTRAGTKGYRLKPEKGLNFPDTDLGLSALTDDDRAHLAFVASHADMVGYSFVQSADDIRALQVELERLRPADWRRLALIAKIETPKAVRNLPGIIVAAAGRQPFGIMIARGDLAVELGFERTAEMQEEILWLAEAAHVPVIWATQVLESLVKTGLPTRGEMTDAAMAARAECVMLNKGPNVVAAVTALDRLLTRMAEHQVKKTPRLRALRSF